jgi:hypothetical protein
MPCIVPRMPRNAQDATETERHTVLIDHLSGRDQEHTQVLVRYVKVVVYHKMTDWHTKEAFDARMAARRANLVPPTPLTAFYHAALLPGWEPIVEEQMALCSHVGLGWENAILHAFVLAEEKSHVTKFLEIATDHKVTVHVLGASGRFEIGEGATLNFVCEHARQYPEGSVLYFHTKGASAPQCQHKRQWRRAMMRHVVAEWEHNLAKLAVDDLVGCAWQTDPHFPHFCGNFWMARNDWLASLPHPDEYRWSRPDFQWAGTQHSWQRRIYVETWVGSRPYHSVHDRVGFNARLWSGDVHGIDVRVPGFEYDSISAPSSALHS